VAAFEEVQPLFQQCVMLYQGVDDNDEGLIIRLLEIAQNSHLLAKHEEAIEIVLRILAHAEDSSALKNSA